MIDERTDGVNCCELSDKPTEVTLSSTRSPLSMRSSSRRCRSSLKVERAPKPRRHEASGVQLRISKLVIHSRKLCHTLKPPLVEPQPHGHPRRRAQPLAECHRVQ